MNGKKISINYITYENRRLSDFAQAIQTQLADIGIEAKINSMDADREWNKMVAGEYDLCDSNWITVGNGDPTEYMATGTVSLMRTSVTIRMLSMINYTNS